MELINWDFFEIVFKFVPVWYNVDREPGVLPREA